ncbi:sodium:proline symporter [Orientia tsutsugamushi]|uniref:hybrid sensor histidine kinase/response regulator n=1 Tax=Orientia tsutsugamushi TaxID=784 RepID=UPI0005F901B0|nr:ATP-binding protein [Orientia tsutsugamushi]KJV71373.1 solute symporter family protein [Orientia tsutsugamushi str. TA763]SPP24619.1 sodium:proline symporter [Orientia tsutsugamushi]SPP25293.1 sodium:proline symporter [Orientia tsutsugamushi]
MPALNIDLILVGLFLIANLAIGLWYGKGVKSVRDYAISGRNFSTATLATTLIATFIGGGTFSLGLYEIYSIGILALFSIIGQTLCLLLYVYVLIPRMQEFFGKLSVAEVMNDLYGNHVRIIAAVCSIIVSATRIAIQIKVFSTMFNHFLLIDSAYATLISSIVVIIYSAFGGIRAVVFTDIFQALTFGAFIPTLTILIWGMFGSWNSIVHTLTTNPIFDPKILMDYHDTTTLKYYGKFFYNIIPCFIPAMFHRVLIARSTVQAANAFKIMTLMYLVFCFFTGFIGLTLLSSYQKIEAHNLVPYIIDSYAYPGFKGLIVIGISAMLMSTADSDINSASVIFVHDLCKPLGLFQKKTRLEIIAVKVFAIFIGVLGLYIALLQKNLLDIILFGASFYTPIVGIPLMFTILGFRTTTRVIVSGMIAGISTTFIWNKFFNAALPIGDLMPATIANFIVMMIMHYCLGEPGGWVGPSDRRPLNVLKEKRKQQINSISSFFKSLYHSFSWDNICAYCNNETFRGRHYYIEYSVITAVSLMVMSLCGQVEHHVASAWLITKVSVILLGLVMTTALLYNNKWNADFRTKYLGLIWHVTIFYTLVFSNTLLTMIGGSSPILLMCFISNLVVAGILLQWHTALFMILLGVPVGARVFNILASWRGYLADYNEVDNNLGMYVIWALALLGAILLFIRLRQNQFVDNTRSMLELKNDVDVLNLRLNTKSQKMEILLNTEKHILNNLSHEIKSPLSVVRTTINLLSKFLPKYYKDTEMIFKEKERVLTMVTLANSGIERLVVYSNNLFDLSKFAQGQMIFDIELNNFQLMLKEIIAECNKVNVAEKHIISLNYVPQAETMFEFDHTRIKTVMLNLISNAIQYSQSGLILITVKPYRSGVEVSIEDEGVGIPENELEAIFVPFEESSRTKSKACGRGLGLTLAKEIILAHHGEIWAENRPNNRGSKFTFRLPLRQPEGGFNKAVYSKSEVFGKIYKDRIAKLLQGFGYECNSINSLKELENHIRVNKSILIVDDDQNVLDAISLDIYAEQYTPEPVNNASEAVRLIKENPLQYSLVLLDMVMPEKSGEQVVQEIYTVTKMYGIPIIIISGYSQTYETKNLLYSMGVVAFIEKPYTYNELRNVINHYLKQTIIPLPYSYLP